MIEFHCPHCDKLLRTPDNKAGVKANCPGCGELVVVPESSARTVEPANVEARKKEVSRRVQPASPYDEEEEHADHSDGTRDCPMCGAEIDRESVRCEFCGENLEAVPARRRGEWEPARIDLGEIFSHTWQIYQKHLGILIGGVLLWVFIPGIISLVISTVEQLVLGALTIGMGAGGGGQPGAAMGVGFLLLAIGMGLFNWIINIAVQCFFNAGGNRFLLRIIQDDKGDVADLFGGKAFLLRMIGATLLYALMVILGCLLLIVPGIIFALMFWPYAYIIVDRNVGVMESFEKSRQIMSQNYLTVFGLGLVGFFINMLGVVTCIGWIFTVPFVFLMLTVAYCGMSNQLEMNEES